jgi:pyruvate dehydrogenase E2 component (dihydrolipoamide acetyltransferase)
MKDDFGFARKVTANKTLSSWKSVPHVSFIYEANVMKVFAKYREIKGQIEKMQNLNITFNVVILKILAEALKKSPKLTSSFNYNKITHKGKYITSPQVNLNVPWIFPNGEMIPINIRDFGNKSLKQLALEMEEIKQKIDNTNVDRLLQEVVLRDTKEKLRRGNLFMLLRLFILALHWKSKTTLANSNKLYLGCPIKSLTKDDIGSEGIVISNIGSLYKEIKGSFALLEVITPKIIAIGLSAMQDRAVVKNNSNRDKEIQIGKILPVCIAFDHRAVDFYDIAKFIQNLEEILNFPNCLDTS